MSMLRAVRSIGGTRRGLSAAPVVRALAVWGPGILVMLADTDAGNVVAAAKGGALWGYRLLPLVLLLIPMLYLIQELTARMGVYTGRGHAELIRERYGFGWALIAMAGLAAAAIGSLVTEFTGVAGIGEMFGLPRSLTLPMAAAALLAIVGAGVYRRVERAAIVIGLFELAFFAVAWAARPSLAQVASDAVRIPFGDRQFLYMVAAIIGATFNPWMVFYQQSATVDKRLQPADLRHARIDTAVGAVLTQCLTGAVLIAAAATFAYGPAPASLTTVGEISGALTPSLGATMGKVVFGAGVLGASLVAAIVASLALAWGVGEIVGMKRTLETHPFATDWFYGVYALCVAGSAVVVWDVSDLVWLNVAAQVLNAFLMPLVVGFLVALAATVLPEPYRLRGWRMKFVVGICALVSASASSGDCRRCSDARIGDCRASAERQRRLADARLDGCCVGPEGLGELARVDPVRPVPLEAHLAHLAHHRRKEADRTEERRRQRADAQRSAERIRRDLQDLARGASGRARQVPGLPEGRIGSVQQGRHGAGDVGHIGVVVRDVGRAEEERRLAAGERPDRRIAEVGKSHVWPVKVGLAQCSDPRPALSRGLHPDARCGGTRGRLHAVSR